MCGDIAPDFKKLIGLRIGGGFHRAVRERLGGVHGCTHIVELLGPVATTAFQTVSSGKARELNRAHRDKTGDAAKPRDPNAAAKPRRKPYMHRHLPHLGLRRRRHQALGAATSTPAPTPRRCAPPAAGKEVEMEG